MSENREDSNWDTAQQTHREIQEEILHSRNLELFGDVERLLPKGEFPTCLEQEMEVDPWDPAEKKAKKLPGVDRAMSKNKPKSAEDGGGGKENGKGKAKAKSRGHEIPEGGHEGFKSVAELLRRAGDLPKDKMVKGGKKHKSGVTHIQSESEEDEGEGDTEEEEREAELLFGHIPGNPTNRTVSKKKKSALSKVSKPMPKPKETKATKEKIPSAVTIVSDSDNDDLDLGEQRDDDGVEVIDVRSEPVKKARTEPAALTKPMPISSKASTPPPKRAAKQARSITPEDVDAQKEVVGSGLDFINFKGPIRRHVPTRAIPSSPSPSSSPAKEAADDRRPVLPAKSQPTGTPTTHNRLSPNTAARAGFSQLDPIDFSWDDDMLGADADMEEDSVTPAVSKPKLGTNPKPNTSLATMPMPMPNPASARARIMGLTKGKSQTPTPGPLSNGNLGKSGFGMPPPPVPDRTPSSPLVPVSRAQSSHDETQPVRPMGRRIHRPIVPSSDDREELVLKPVKRRRVMTLDDVECAADEDTRGIGMEGGVDESPFLPPQRLRRRHADSSPVAEQRRKKKAKVMADRARAGIYVSPPSPSVRLLRPQARRTSS